MPKLPKATSGNVLKIKVAGNFLKGLESVRTDLVQTIRMFWVTFTANYRKHFYDCSLKTETNKKTITKLIMAQQTFHGSLPTNISQLQPSRCKIRIIFTKRSTEIIPINKYCRGHVAWNFRWLNDRVQTTHILLLTQLCLDTCSWSKNILCFKSFLSCPTEEVCNTSRKLHVSAYRKLLKWQPGAYKVAYFTARK